MKPSPHNRMKGPRHPKTKAAPNWPELLAKDFSFEALKLCSKLTVGRIAQLCDVTLLEARAMQVEFLKFANDNGARFPKWKTELDAWLEFRIEQKKLKRAA